MPQYILALIIWGSIGLFVREIDLPSSLIALSRGLIGASFLFIVAMFMGRKLHASMILTNWKPLLLAGAGLGLNWIFLFEAYRATSVATATLAYYMAPVIMILLTPLILKEKVTVFKLFCAAVAVFGMILISGVFDVAGQSVGIRGIAMGLVAACLYAMVVFSNKFLKGLDSFESSIIQLAISIVIVTPYVATTVEFGAIEWTVQNVGLTLAVGIVHTGIAYGLYFSALPKLEAVRIAIFSYIDPALAILLSVFVLDESMTVFGVVGAVLILGATLISEVVGTNGTKQYAEAKTALEVSTE